MTARRAAVLGSPISHSLSPVLHRAAYQKLGLLNWTYDAIECDEAGLPPILALADSAAGRAVAGYSCTMPLKRRALELSTTASAAATVIGAANTLTPAAGGATTGWHADNTDIDGVRGALAAAGVDSWHHVGLLGAGGTAQAVLAALLMGAGEVQTITVLVRNPARTTELLATADRLRQAAGSMVSAGPAIRVRSLEQANELADCDLVVSTLPAGAADSVARLPWRDTQVLLDVLYRPWPTALAAAAMAVGATVIGGASMLLHQAARQVELMTGCEAPVPAMKAALLAAAPNCGF